MAALMAPTPGRSPLFCARPCIPRIPPAVLGLFCNSLHYNTIQYPSRPAPRSIRPAFTFQLTNSLQSHYIGALLRQLYKIVGSFDFLGDPVGVLSQAWTI